MRLSKRSVANELTYLEVVVRMFDGRFGDIMRAFMSAHVDKDVFEVSNLLLHLVLSCEFETATMR